MEYFYIFWIYVRVIYTKCIRWRVKIKNKYFKILMMALLVLLSGCKSDGFVLKGDSDSWKGDYRVTLDNQRETSKFTLYYKKDDWRDVGKYTINVNDGSIILEEEGLLNRTITIPVTRMNSTMSKDSTINIEISWDNHSESLILKD
jgi:hypothetical protein